ncbi:MAG: DUF2279 domain-containing protein [Bacteroidetes bacterium]|nr:DUF2279 domain-containing protein [Bacteroidota bacterium]
MKSAVGYSPASLASHSCTWVTLLGSILFSLLPVSVFCQPHPDSTISSPSNYISNKNFNYSYHKKKVTAVALANIAGYGGAMVGLYAAWYKNYPQTKMHAFNDIKEWMQIDKIGHAYSAYAESKASMELWRWTGISRKKQIWIGGLSGAFYQTVIEILDGFSAEWGWSWPDFGANLIGSSLLISQELAWNDQRIQFKWSFHNKSYNDPMLNKRSDVLFGTGVQRFLKDYNGQSYWLSTAPASWIPNCKLPPWLQISIGTGADGMFGGYENIGKNPDGSINFSRPDIKRYRQWYLAPDIDLTKIPTRRKGIKTLLNIINIIKFPTPGLELSNGKLHWRWLIF